jgi:uncharacterized membrane protein
MLIKNHLSWYTVVDVWGSVPRYWEIRLQNKTFHEAIANELINAQGILYEEPYRLFMDDMRDIVQVSTLLSLIGNGANRSLIEIGRTEAVMEEVTEGFNRYVSGHWENLCRKSVSGMGKRYGLASRWWGSV